MIRWTKSVGVLVIGCVLGIWILGVFDGYSQEKVSRRPKSYGIYIDLTEDYYRALQEDPHRSSRKYYDNMADEYLRQISVSTKFMVETNLQILKQQEQILELLQSVTKKNNTK